MAENVKVIVRCRPMNQKERELNCQPIVKTQNCVIEIWDPNDGPALPKQFTFDSTYGDDSTTEAIYNDICYPLVESVLEGYNATIFVYGQTGCGKSHTMGGDKQTDKGIISRAFEHIFEAIAVTSGVKYLAMVSYLEIYNEQIRDLLLPSDKQQSLSLKESNEGVSVPGLTAHPVQNSSECERYLNLGSQNRMIGATLMNQNSSRSHSIFTISVEQNEVENASIRKGKLNLVDLAGSERQAKTGATGERLREATKINLSLSALGNVISALVDGKARHIPYRDSKLTRLLQDSLGGNTRTLMIACVSPASRDYAETLSTLRYANRAKNIHNRPKVNEDPKDAILRQYQEEIDRLKGLLENRPTHFPVSEINENAAQDPRLDRLLASYEHEMAKLKNLHENERAEKENVLEQIGRIKEEYEENLAKLKQNPCSPEEIVKRIATLKAAMIGGERAGDRELSERRRRKKRAAEQRASVIAHLLAKIEQNEDREVLQNQYEDISHELNLRTEMLRRYRHKVKTLEKDIRDLQGEFESEREDYLETIRKQDRNVKLLTQISEKIVGTIKKDCNYTDLESIKERAVWLEDAQKFKLPELTFPRTKLPPAGRPGDIQTAPARLNSFTRDEKPQNDSRDIIETYFPSAMKRANELLNRSGRTGAAFDKWRGADVSEYAKRRSIDSSKPCKVGTLPNINGKRDKIGPLELIQ